MATAPSTRSVWTYADLEDLPEDDNIYDILGGELVVRNVPIPEHAEVLTELLIFFAQMTTAGYGRMYTTSSAVALDFAQHGQAALNVPHPDIFFVRQGRRRLWGKRGFDGVPDLIVEILSPTTLQEHRPGGRWWEANQRNGVPHYWLVDPQARTIRQFTLVGEPYVAGRYDEPVMLREGDTLTSPLFPAVTLPVAQVFRYVGGEGDEDDSLPNRPAEGHAAEPGG